MAEIAGDVVRIVCLLEILLMALVTIAVHELIIVIHMARGTLSAHMCSGEWKPRCCVIKRGTVPVDGGMALRAIVAEIAGHVIRVRRLLKILLMALIAIRKHELIVTVDVTRLALRGNVRACQRKAGRGMIECRRSPICR
jgi:hypothetical protein